MKTLQFNKNGKFRILQISDVQDTKATSVDTLNFLEAAISETKPDLIVLTGDQLDVVGLWGKGEKLQKNVRNAIMGIMAPIKASGIPFILTFGNHDCQTGMPNDEQAKIYAEIENCICFDDMNDGRPDAGTYNQLIMSSDGSKPAMNIYMVDSNSAHPTAVGGYDMVHDNQVAWCKKKSLELKVLNGGKAIPSILFQHIPVWEIYDVLKEVPKGTKGALAAFRSRKGKYFTLDDEAVWQKGTYGEVPSVPEEANPQFDAVVEQGDVFAMYFGHDHYNSFVGRLKGIDLGYCPGAGYNTYGLNPRGMRVFDFDENDVTNYETKVLRVDDFYKKPLYEPVKNFVLINAPSSLDAAIPFTLKVLPMLIAVIAASIILNEFVPVAVSIFWIAVAVFAAGYGVFSLIRNSVERKKLLSKFNKK